MKTIYFKQIGFGQWIASTDYYGKKISIHFTSAPIYDLIISKERGYKKAIKNLRDLIIYKNKNN